MERKLTILFRRIHRNLGQSFHHQWTGMEDGMRTQIIADTVSWGGTGDGFIIYEEGSISHPTLPAEIELVH